MTHIHRRRSNNTFTIPNSASLNYFHGYIDVVDQRFLGELKQVIDGSKAINDLAVVDELHQAFFIEEQNINREQQIAFELLDINRDIVARIINAIEQLINYLSLCISSPLNTNEIRNITDLEDRYYTRILNEWISLFNINHRILIQLIEQNDTESTDFVSAQSEQVLCMIDQNTIFRTCPIIHQIAQRSFQCLQLANLVKKPIPKVEVISDNYPQPQSPFPTNTAIWLYIVLTGVTILSAILISLMT